MPKYPIDLGRSMKESMPEMATSPSSEKHYPSLYLDWDSDYKLPDSGTMVIKFNKTSESNSKSKGSKPRQSVTLEITSIESVKGGKSESKDEDTGAALDRLKKEVESESEDESENYKEE
jgi:hypothetical protein